MTRGNMLSTSVGDLDDQDEDGDEPSGPRQKKFSFLPAFGAFSALLVSRGGLLTKMFQIQRTLFTIGATG
jgi:hypothetical protein